MPAVAAAWPWRTHRANRLLRGVLDADASTRTDAGHKPPWAEGTLDVKSRPTRRRAARARCRATDAVSPSMARRFGTTGALRRSTPGSPGRDRRERRRRRYAALRRASARAPLRAFPAGVLRSRRPDDLDRADYRAFAAGASMQRARIREDVAAGPGLRRGRHAPEPSRIRRSLGPLRDRIALLLAHRQRRRSRVAVGVGARPAGDIGRTPYSETHIARAGIDPRAGEAVMENRFDEPWSASSTRTASSNSAAAGLARGGDRDSVQRRHRDACSRRTGHLRDPRRRLHGFPRDARRARQDAAPADPRRHPGVRSNPESHGRPGVRRPRSSRSTWSSSTSTRSRRPPHRGHRRGRRGRDDRHRRSGAGARRGQEPRPRRRRRRPRGLRSVAEELESRGGLSDAARRLGWRQGVPPHQRVRPAPSRTT